MKFLKEYLIISILIGGVLCVSFSNNFFAGFESFFEDLLFSPKPLSSEIVIVAIDNESLNRIGQWPWPRAIFARVFEAMSARPPKSVALDVVFADASRLGEKDDIEFEKALATVPYPVTLPLEAHSLILNNSKAPYTNSVTLPIFLSSAGTGLGHVNLILDKDGVVRRFPPVIRYETKEFRNFAYETIKKNGEGIPQEENIQSTMRIVYAGPPGSVRRIPLYRFLEAEPPDVQGKLVFIGVTASDLHDEKPTPFSRGTQMPGIEIQANIANMFLSGYRLQDIPRRAMFVWILFAAIVPALFFRFFKRSWMPVLITLIFGAVQFVIMLLLFERGAVPNFVHINLAWILSMGSFVVYRYMIEEREKRELKAAFSKYVSSDVLQEIMKNPAKIALGGEEREITVLFSDIRGFTTLSEKTTPKELVRILNKYFTAMTNEILKHHGVLDKYIGDAIMAFWGAPLADADQAKNALLAARGMAERLKAVNRELAERGDPTIAIGIGIYTGPAIVGNMGSEERFDYTAMGDTVNVASRLEGLNKEYKTTLIVGESTKNKLGEEFRAKFLGAVPVKGRSEPVRIYAVDV